MQCLIFLKSSLVNSTFTEPIFLGTKKSRGCFLRVLSRAGDIADQLDEAIVGLRRVLGW
jgi:hypothetical protein